MLFLMKLRRLRAIPYDSYCFKFCSTSSETLSKLDSILLTMPRDRKRKAEMQHQRLKIKEKSSKYSPGRVTLQVLGSGAPGAPRSLYVFTDQSRYLFNCGEGVQRLAHEHKMKLAKLEHIFVTYPSWDNIGGLPGVALTIQDVGVPEITLHGPPGTDEIFSATRRFVILRDLSIRMANFKQNKKFEDNVMTVEYVPLFKENVTDSRSETTLGDLDNVEENLDESDDDIDYYEHEQKCHSRIQKHDKRRSLSEARNSSTMDFVKIPMSMCYICKLKSRRGTLNYEACVDRGVQPGPLLGKLKNGEDVELEDGTIVRSCDVTTPDDIGPVFIVVECPSEDYLESLLSAPALKRHQESNASEEEIAYTVVHFTPSNIIKHPRYQEWMRRFLSSTLHLVINDRNKCMGSLAVHRVQHKLNLLDENIFPLLSDSQSCRNDLEECFTNDGVACIKGQTFTNIHLRPRHGFDPSVQLVIDPEEYVRETMDAEGFSDELKRLKLELADFKPVSDSVHPKILFLGTGSCIPNKTRNTSGILVHTQDSECVLLDCGEATYGQMVRFYGLDETKRILRDLKCIYVSHLHADHHIGLIGVLNGRRQAFEGHSSHKKPVILMAPKQIMSWLQLYHRRFEPLLDEFTLVCNTEVPQSSHSAVLKEMRMRRVQTVPVRHCPNAFGVAFEHEDGWKLTYSGDTMPCAALVNIGMNSDVLIHEATMEDELASEAKAKFHSTTSQAIDIGRQMNAGFIILTHFSQRYARLPRFNDNFTENIGIAFDNMLVSLNQLPLLPKMFPALKIMFADHYEELEMKAQKRLLREKTKRSASSSPVRTVKTNFV